MSSGGGSPTRWVVVVFSLNLGLVLAHVAVFWLTRSQLVLAQGADSLMDVAVNAVLAVSAWVGAKPKDEGHPFGHGRAEPIGALVASVLAFVLAFEVGRSAVAAAFAHVEPDMDASTLGVLGAKLVIKAGLLAALSRRARRERGPAMQAVVTDTRNDLVATSTSLLGWATVRAGFPLADALLALPVSLYIAYNGAGLLRENLRYLMGEAPAPEVLASLRRAAEAVPGVSAVGEILAHHVGSQLHVEITIVIGPALSAVEGHDIGVRVQQAIEAVDVVARTFVHVEPAADADLGPQPPRA